MAKEIYGLSLRDILPSSLAGDPQIESIIDALDPELQSVSFDTREALIYSRIDELPEDVIDLLAWQFHVDFYEPLGMALEIKRGLVKTAILVHKRKGTRWAVQELCDTVFGETKVEPWFEYGGEPYHFRVSTEGRFPSEDDWKKFFLALEVTKSVRDWLDSVQIERSADMEIVYGHGSCMGGYVTLSHRVDGTALENPLCLGIGSVLQGIVLIASEGVD